MRDQGRSGGAGGAVRGVTLPELLVVLAIAAFLLMAGVPALGALLDRSRVAAATTAMAVSLANTRMRAVEGASPYTLCPSVGGQHCDPAVDWSHGWIAFADLDRSGQREDGERVVDRVDPGTGSQVRIRTTQGRTRLVFQPDGSAGGSNVTLEFCPRRPGADGARQIIVSNVGRARLVQHPTVTRCNE